MLILVSCDLMIAQHLILSHFAKTSDEGILSIVIQFRESTWAIGCMWSTVLDVYRVKLITSCQRAKTFETFRKLTKFRLNWGTNILLGYKFGSKSEFYKSLTVKNC